MSDKIPNFLLIDDDVEPTEYGIWLEKYRKTFGSINNALLPYSRDELTEIIFTYL